MPKVKYVEQLTQKAKRARTWQQIVPASKVVPAHGQHVVVHHGARY